MNAAFSNITLVIADDEAPIRMVVGERLRSAGFTVHEARDGEEALELVRKHMPTAIVTDLQMPYMNGLELCIAMRADGRTAHIPAMLLTARGHVLTDEMMAKTNIKRVMAKPFGVREFVARVRALLRRPRAVAAAGDGSRPVQIHGIEIDPARRRVVVRGVEVELTSQEFRLLHLLATHPGIVFSREALLAKVWPDNTFVTPRSVDTLVKRLRKRIEIDTEAPALVLTVWGAGYKFADV